MAKELTPRQKIYYRERAVGVGRLEAQTIAGYKPDKGNAKRLDHRPEGRAYMQEIATEAAELAGVHLGRVLLELAHIGYANMADYTKAVDGIGGRGGRLVHDLSNLTREQAAAIKEYAFDSKGRPKLTLHDKRAALADLLKFLAPGKVGDGNQPAPDVMNFNLMQIIAKFDGMSELEIARRIAFAMQAGSRQIDGQANPPTPPPADQPASQGASQ